MDFIVNAVSAKEISVEKYPLVTKQLLLLRKPTAKSMLDNKAFLTWLLTASQSEGKFEMEIS